MPRTHQDGIHRSVDGGAHWLPGPGSGARGWLRYSRTRPPRPSTAGILGGLLPIDVRIRASSAKTAPSRSASTRDGSASRPHSEATSDPVRHTPPPSRTTRATSGSSRGDMKSRSKCSTGWTNGNLWVFFGALSNVEYTITVTDTATGAVQSYFDIQGTLTSVADTSAFPASGPPPSFSSSRRELARPALADACAPGPNALCLNGGRFRVDVAYSRTPLGPTMPRPPFRSPRHGLLLVLRRRQRRARRQGSRRAQRQRTLWVFFGALSDVGYSITVTDTATGSSASIKTCTARWPASRTRARLRRRPRRPARAGSIRGTTALFPVVLLAFVVVDAARAAATWTNIGPEGAVVLAIAADPVTDHLVYAGVQGGGVFRSDPASSTFWHAANTGLGDLNVRALATSPAGGGVVLAGTARGSIGP